MNTIETMQALLQTLDPTFLQIHDDSHEHVGHAGAKSGGHFTVEIASPRFAGLSKIAQHRLVYAALGDLQVLKIHALRILVRG